MFAVFRQPFASFATPLKPIVGVATAALLIGWAAGVGAQGSNPAVPSLPPVMEGDTVPKNVPLSTQAPAGQQPPAGLMGSNPNLPPLPLSHADVREAQNQLIALGFDPGPADGEAGAGTVAAAQQYDRSRGGSGQVSIDSALLARLKADTAPRLTYDQVAARSQAHSQARAPGSSGNQARAPTSGGSQFGGVGAIVQQLAPLIGTAITNSNNSNNGNYGGGYGYGGGYPGQGYSGPGPGYRGYPYGGY